MSCSHTKQSFWYQPPTWDDYDIPFKEYVRGGYTSSFRNGAANGCQMCSMVCEILSKQSGLELSDLTGMVEFGTYCIIWTGIQPPAAHGQEQTSRTMKKVITLYTSTDIPWRHVSFDLAKAPSSYPGIHGTGRHLPHTTFSDETFMQITKWIKHCDTYHHCYKNPEARQQLPSRILDLSLVDLDFTVRLHEPTELQFARYACLSHCWGGTISKNATTTKASIKNIQRGIPCSSLPKTFRDAVEVARKLGLRYLWIDSLCIIQDDPEDWTREARQMASIFQNAYITFAATSSANSDGGLFSFLPEERRTKTIKCKAADGRLFDLHFRERIPHPHFNTASDRFPLLTRGWVLQERLLSPRLLHFTSSEVLWECGKDLVCQCSDGLELSCNTSSKLSHNHWLVDKNTTVSDLSQRWHSLINDFWRLSLSFEKDRLAAVAGLAAQWSQNKSMSGKPLLGRYLEGLWESTIHEDICWTVNAYINSDMIGCSRPSKKQAPTWTWASIQQSPNVPLGWVWVTHQRVKRRYAKFLEAGFVDHRQACQEFVRYNYLRLQVPLKAALLRYNYENHLPRKQFYLQTTGCDESSDSFFKGHGQWVCPDYDFRALEEGHIPDGTAVYCALVSQCDVNRRHLGPMAEYERHHGSEIYLMWLILIQLNGGDELYYRRIGFLIVQVGDSNKIPKEVSMTEITIL